MDKSTYRKEILIKRNSLSNEECDFMSRKIFKLLKSTNILDFKNILVYSDFKNEVKTDEIIDYLFDNKRAVYLPKCNVFDKTFSAVRISRDKLNLFENKYGIKEPTENSINITEKIDCVIMPGIVFDISGNRIGFGCGYYDKFLHNNPQALKIALCYDFQVVDAIDASEHDVPMDIIITEKRIIDTRRG